MKIKNHLLRKIIGIFLIIIGIIALFLPFTPGWLLIFFGLVLLDWHILKNLTKKIKSKIKK